MKFLTSLTTAVFLGVSSANANDIGDFCSVLAHRAQNSCDLTYQKEIEACTTLECGKSAQTEWEACFAIVTEEVLKCDTELHKLKSGVFGPAVDQNVQQPSEQAPTNP